MRKARSSPRWIRRCIVRGESRRSAATSDTFNSEDAGAVISFIVGRLSFTKTQVPFAEDIHSSTQSKPDVGYDQYERAYATLLNH